jgi:hypothetical protein
MTPVVFFSHSSLDNDRVKAMVDALEATGALKTTFDVRDLRHGEEFAPQLYKWIARCHGAIVLLTSNVMKRAPWVLQEATMLRARSILEGKEFRLFVVADAEVLTDPVWTTWFEPLKLDAVQRLTVVKPGDDPLERIIKAVVDGLEGAGVTDGDYFSRYARKLASALRKLTSEEEAVEVLSSGLKIEDADWVRIVGSDSTLTSLFAQRLCQGDFGSFATIDGLFNTLQSLSPPPVREALLGVLRSYWVPLEHAAHFADVLAHLAPPQAGDERPRNIVLLQTDYAQPGKVAEMHRERQFLPYNQLGTWVDAGGGNESQDNLLESVRLALEQELFPGEPGIDVDDVIQNRKDAYARRGYTFVHVAAPATTTHLLPVARRFWPCLFVLTVPRGRCEEIAQRLAVPVLAMPPDGVSDITHLRAIGVAESHARK